MTRSAAFVLPFALLGACAGFGSSDRAVVADDEPMGDQNLDGTPYACPDVDLGDAALCVCDDLDKAGANLRVDGHVGVDGVTTIDGSNVGVAGSFVAYGGMSLSGATVKVDRDLSVGADLSRVRAILTVGGPVKVAGQTSGLLGVDATAYDVSGPPCACGDDQIVDVAALVDAKAAAGATSLTSIGANKEVTLETGEYVYDALSAAGSNVHLRIQGQVSLYVRGSLDAIGSNEAITLDPGASLDLYVSDVVHAVGSNVVLGDGTPGAFRLYMGGAGDQPLALGSNGRFDGVVYAPKADLEVGGSNVEITGALFAKSLSSAGANVHIGYADPAPGNCLPPEPGDPGDPGEQDPGTPAGDVSEPE
jgi:hypothetical protein